MFDVDDVDRRPARFKVTVCMSCFVFAYHGKMDGPNSMKLYTKLADMPRSIMILLVSIVSPF